MDQDDDYLRRKNIPAALGGINYSTHLLNQQQPEQSGFKNATLDVLPPRISPGEVDWEKALGGKKGGITFGGFRGPNPLSQNLLSKLADNKLSESQIAGITAFRSS
eukprot:6934123-Pyramimonas_sp.AAC.1